MRNAGKIMIVASATLALVACSPSKEQPSDLPPGVELTPTDLPAVQTTAPPATPSPSGSAQEGECTASDVEVTGEFGVQPQVAIPRDCAKPTTLTEGEIEPGIGPGAETGDTIEVDYALFAWSDGEVKDSTFDVPQARTTTLGSGELIEGFEEGVIDMRQQGRRVIVVPPKLGFGEASGNPLRNETLVFVVDAIRVEKSD